ncbi:hypothetical protein cypCar_00003396 [Cyprinus carpio]|nr:hypothetical protein cypCar_00003396 [Cyprinus carpio]
MAAPLELFCWKGDYGLPSVDVDCLAVLAYAKFAGAPLKVHKITNPWRSPTGTLPALKTREEGSISQPSKIIIHLRKQKYNADYDLSAKEGADTLAFVSLLEEKLLPALIYTLWIDSKNYVDVTRCWYAENISFPLNFLLPNRMHCQQLEKLRLMRGDPVLEPGEQLEKELCRDAFECMTLLSQRLGSQKFFFGDSPSSLDAYVFAHLAPLLKIKLPNGKLQQHLNSLNNLQQYCTNILALYFPSDARAVATCFSGRVVCDTAKGFTDNGGKYPPLAETQIEMGLDNCRLVAIRTSRTLTQTPMATACDICPKCLPMEISLTSVQWQGDICDMIIDGDETPGRKIHAQPDSSDLDNEPHKRRNQILSVLFAVGAMLGYAILTGIVTIKRERPQLKNSGHDDGDEEDED